MKRGKRGQKEGFSSEKSGLNIGSIFLTFFEKGDF